MHNKYPAPPIYRDSTPRLLVVCGPTASGKTDLSLEWAKKNHWPVINADSRQVYAEMAIGTARPSEMELEGVEHYLFGTKSILNHYNAGTYALEVEALLKNLFKQNGTVILSGGTGLYIQALISGLDEIPTYPLLRLDLESRLKVEGIEILSQELIALDPEYATSADLKNPLRVIRALEVVLGSGKRYSAFRSKRSKELYYQVEMVMPTHKREELYNRINQRTQIMIQSGWVEEARNLLKYKDLKALQTVGYPELFRHLEGELSLETTVELISQKTRNYAKRQITFFSNQPAFANLLKFSLVNL